MPPSSAQDGLIENGLSVNGFGCNGIVINGFFNGLKLQGLTLQGLKGNRAPAPATNSCVGLDGVPLGQ